MDWPAGQWLIAADRSRASSPTAPTSCSAGSPRSTPSTSTPRARAARPARPTCASARSATSARASPSPSSAGLILYGGDHPRASKSGSLDQALQQGAELPLRPVLLVAIAAGIICYGLFCFARARHLSQATSDHEATSTCDVVVLGLGPGGEHVAIKLARAGLDVIGVEDRLVGGECPYYGCVPSKMMIAAAHVIADARKVADFGGTARVEPDWATVAQRIRDEATDDWDDAVAVKRLEDSGARFVRGRGVLVGPGRVRVGGTTYAARKGVVLNTGTEPAAPPIEGLQGTPYWTNRDAVAVTELPGSVVVLGGGPIGCEFAQVFSRYGVDVTVVEMADRLIAIEEPEASELLEKAFADEGITVLTGASVARSATTRAVSPSTSTASRSTPRSCWWPPAARPTSTTSAWTPCSIRRPARRPARHRDRRADARRREARQHPLGDRRHHGQGRLHARVDVPGRRGGARRTGGGRSVGRLPRGPARHVHLTRGRPDWAVAQRIRDEATDDWDDPIAVKRLEDSRRPLRARAGACSPGPAVSASAAPRTSRRKGVVLNTGTAPAAPPIDGLAGTPYWTNRDAVAAHRAARPRWSCWAAGRSAASSPRSSPGSASTSPCVEVADRLVAIEEPEASEVLHEGVRGRGHHGARRRRRSPR